MRTIAIFGFIGAGVLAKDIAATLSRDPYGSVTLAIDSAGGSVAEALAIHRALAAHRGPVFAHVEGECASAANYVLAAAPERTAHRDAKFLVHAPGFAPSDLAKLGPLSAADLRDMARAADAVTAEMIALISGGCRVSPRWLSARVRKAEWFDAREALQGGLIDRIEGCPAGPTAAGDRHAPARPARRLGP